MYPPPARLGLGNGAGAPVEVQRHGITSQLHPGPITLSMTPQAASRSTPTNMMGPSRLMFRCLRFTLSHSARGSVEREICHLRRCPL